MPANSMEQFYPEAAPKEIAGGRWPQSRERHGASPMAPAFEFVVPPSGGKRPENRLKAGLQAPGCDNSGAIGWR